MSDSAIATPSRSSQMLTWPQVRQLTTLSRATVWALRRKGAFPRPVQISANRIAWRQSDLESWISARAEGGNVR